MNAASPRYGKWARRAGVLLLGWLALWLVAWLAVPPLVKSQLQRIGSERLGREVTVGRVDFKPWTLELTLSDLKVAGLDGQPPQLAVRRLYADAELQSVVRLAPVIDALQIDAPAVRLTHRPDGHYDIDDILARLASRPADASTGKTPRFAIHNIAVQGGSIDFDDQTVGRQHTVRDLVLQVPSLGNLGALRDVQTAPKLAFIANGSAFDSQALALPFSDSRKTDARLSFKGLDLAPYLGYMPAGLPAQLRSGTLDAELQVDFERATTGGLKISGTVQANGVKVADARAHEMLAFQSLKVELTDVRPLEGVFQFGEVALDDPRLTVARDGSGRLALLATDPATGVAKQPAGPAAGAAVTQPAEAARAPLRVAVARLRLAGGEIGWRDATTQPAAAIDLTKLTVQASDITWPMNQPARFDGSAAVAGAVLQFKGEATDKRADVQTDVAGLALSLAAPYLAQSLVPSLDGKLSGQIDVAWAAPELRFKARRLSADGLALTQGKTAMASVGRFELVGAEADMRRHTLDIASVTATNPKISVERDDQRRWMFERWLRTPDGAQAAAVAAPRPDTAVASSAKAETAPWRLSIGSLGVQGGAVSYADKALATPIAVEVSDLRIDAQKLAPGTANVSPLQFSGRVAAGRADPGRVDYKGSLVLAPLSVDGRLDVTAVPAHAFKPYYADALNIDIRRAFASYRGSFRFASAPEGTNLRMAGDGALEDFRANSVELSQSKTPGLERANSQLLSWKALGLRGLQVAVAPGAPVTVDVRETTLTDFFARVIVEPTGRLNLQNLTRKAAADAPPAAATQTQKEPGGATVTTRVPTATETEARADRLSPRLTFGPMSLVNGRIDFTDQFVKPNYSADLSALTGRLSAFSSQPANAEAGMADLELRGKAQQTASLEITGKINPLSKPLQLDITARMRDLDLPPLTPYSVRYAGHGIERGKLSVDVNYQIAADGRLTATNKLVLNQLRFGEEVKDAPNSLPVRLAVALLTDRNGVIDVDIPLSGSLNDPQFSVGALIFKALGNLIVKAVTAPFSLLTGGFGGGTTEASTIVFEPGQSTLPAQAGPNLDKIAKSLNDRPALQMTVVGTADLDKERDAYRRQRLRQLAQAEKRRAAVRAGQPATADVAPVTDAEYPALLTAVYKRADITKPRNVLGLAKDLPEKEMEDLLLASIPVTEESIRQLAVERGAAVRDYLLERQVPGSQLFLGAVRTVAPDAAWKPAAELNLATR